MDNVRTVQSHIRQRDFDLAKVTFTLTAISDVSRIRELKGQLDRFVSMYLPAGFANVKVKIEEIKI